MNKTLCIISCLLALHMISAHSNEEPAAEPVSLAALEGEPSSIVHGCVSVITGDYVESQADIVIPGVDPLVIQRSYVSHPLTDRSMGHGWSLNHHGFLDLTYTRLRDEDFRDRRDENGQKVFGTKATMTDETGASMIFWHERKASNRRALRPDSKAMEYGVTNTARGVISARTNWDNTRIHYREKAYHAYTGSGTHYIFDKEENDTAQEDVHRLLAIEKPNGNQIKYKYDEDTLKKITLKNRDHQDISWANIERSESKHQESIKISFPGGKEVKYTFYDKSKTQLPRLVVSGNCILTQTYTYDDDSKSAQITRKDLPKNRSLAIDYYAKGKHNVGSETFKIDSSIDNRVNRVKKLMEPVGTDETLIETYKFIYFTEYASIGLNHTKVYDAQDHQTIYHYNRHHRLTKVEKFKGTKDYKLYSAEKLYWGANDSQDKTRLISRSLEDATGHTLFNRYFVYDRQGNVLKDILSGNISGNHPQSVVVDDTGVPSSNNYQFKKTYTYSDDGMNLMLTESDGFSTTEYTYRPGTDLLTAKYYKAQDSIRKRSFYDYDKTGALTLQIEDDGKEAGLANLQGVTERRVTVIKNTSTGLPEVIEEMYLDLDAKQRKLLHKTVNEYDSNSNLKTQTHYNSNLELAYILKWEYDKYGNVQKETNALGHETTYIYDDNGNKKFEQGPNKDYSTKYEYDFSNRLICEEKVCNDGSRFAKHYRYDTLNRLRTTTDIYGNETDYEYDEFGRQTVTTFPPFEDENGKQVQLIARKKYDLMGNVIEQHDACGAKTKTAYTIQGKPYRIEHPDGTIEKNEYGNRGNLLKATAKNGAYTTYTYDDQSRPLTKKVHDANGAKLHTTIYTYNALHLKTEIDPEGNVTEYDYDGAGRLCKVMKGARKTTYEYDTLGRVGKTKEHDGDTIIITLKKYDLLNRVIEERIEDQSGQIFSKTCFEYDFDGNKTKTITESQAGTQVVTTRYDVHKQPIETINAMGQREVHVYDYSTYDKNGQGISKCTTTDVAGNQTITIKDTMDHVVSVEVKNPYSQTLQSYKNSYSAQGRKTRRVETVYTPGGNTREVATCWKYDTMGHVTDIFEAYGTPEQKHTHNDYNAFGQLEIIVKPDGSRIQHRYDSQERLYEHFASDGTFHYQIHYDNLGNPRIVDDLVHQTSTRRVYNPHSQIEEETLGHGLTMKYAYDNTGRLALLTLPDERQVAYAYDPYRLKKVERLGVNGCTLYTHVYDAYDQLGSLLEATMIGNVGKLKQEKDLLNRVVAIRTTQWKETLEAYDPSGNPHAKKIDSPLLGIDQQQFTYDDLQQLQTEPGHTYQHDSLYNRVSKNGCEHSLNALNQLLDDGHAQYTYDLCGRLKTKTSSGIQVEYAYDALDRLLTVTEGKQRTSYVYDADHRRLSKTVSVCDSQGQWMEQNTVRYLYQGKNEIGAMDARGNLVEYRVLGFGHGAEIGAAVAIEFGGKVFAPVHDHNGSVVSLVDVATGQIEEEYKYTAFGEEEIYDSQGQRKESSANPWRYASKRMDEESGFIFFGRRYYNPQVGRWITPDPIGFEGGANVYAYVFNSPLSYFDLYGLIAQQSGGQNFFSQTIGTFFNYAGSVIRFIGDHILPIPFVRQGVSRTGHVLSGGRPQEYRTALNCYSENGCVLGVNGELSPNVRTMYINGIMTDYDEREDGPREVSKYLGGCNVHYTYNSSHGLVMDLLECLAQKLGLPTHSVNLAVKSIKDQIEGVGGVGSGGKVIIMAHSQGGLITQRALEKLSPEELSMIEIITFGSASQINDDRVSYSRNYVNNTDPIPLFDPFGCIKGKFSQNSNTVFMKSNRFFDHGFKSKNYQYVLEEECQRIIKNYGAR